VAAAGDTIRVRAGTYGAQDITGSKTSDTKIIGDDGTVVSSTSPVDSCDGNYADETLMCITADHVWLENVTINSTSNTSMHSEGIDGWVQAAHVTWKNVNIWGKWRNMSPQGDYFTWDGGQVGQPGTTAGPWSCDSGQFGAGNHWGGPMAVGGYAPSRNDLIENLVITPSTVDYSGGCDVHLEDIRLNDASGFTLRNTIFQPGSDAGSGHIYAATGTGISNVSLIGNYFSDPTGTQNPCMQVAASAAAHWSMYYNTFQCAPNLSVGSSWEYVVGNLGPQNVYCGAHNIKNVWGGSGSCGSDTFVGATNLQINTNTGQIGATSPAVDAAETPGAGDYCTDPNTVNSTDMYGTTRPYNGTCDAGAVEYHP
jgi:hypothetical protein